MNNRVYRKKILAEINRLNNILTYCNCDSEDKIYIEKTIKILREEIGYIR